MGKTRRSKSRFIGNSNPLGLADGTELNNDYLMENYTSENGPIESIRGQLQNCNIEEKINGLQSLAVLSGNRVKVAAICSSDILRIVSPLLLEPNNSVRNAAAGALRNMSVCGLEVCEYMVEKDVLTPLLALLGEYASDLEWTPSFDSSMKDQLDLKSDIFLQAVNLVWNLCESTSIALDSFNQSLLLEQLIRCLDYRKYGIEIGISVAQCLLVVSDNNPHSWNSLSNHIPDFLSLLSLDGEYEKHYLCTLSAGILSNVPALAAAYVSNILTALSRTLDVDHCTALMDIESFSLQQEKNTNAPEVEVLMDEEDDETEEEAFLRRRRQELPTELEISKRKVGHLLDAQRLAAEIITNLCSSDEEEWVDTEEKDISENESVHDYDQMKTNLSNIQNNDKLPLDVLENFKYFELMRKLWQRAQPLTDCAVQLIRKTCVELLMKIKNLRVSAMLCLQNMCNTMSLDDLGGATHIYAMWVELGQQVFKGPQDLALLEPSTSLMRSALDHLKSNKELFNQMTESDLELILNGVNTCSIAEIRANWLRMLGTLGCLLHESLVKIIISFILDTCSKEKDVWTMSEAFDALMDMFSDNDWPQIMIELHLFDRIQTLDNIFKTKVRQQRRELNERYPAVQTVRTNLSRFVLYIEMESEKYADSSNKQI